MKLILSLFLISFSFLASAETNLTTTDKKVTVEMSMPGDRGKKSRRDKRVNKRRKRKCQQFGRRGFAG